MRTPLPLLLGLVVTTACSDGSGSTTSVPSSGGSSGVGGSTPSGGTGGTSSLSGGTAGVAAASNMDAGVDSGTGANPDSGADSGSDTGIDSGSEPLSFEADIWPVYEMIRDPVFVYRGSGAFESCVTGGVCHGGANPGAGLSMTDSATAYEMLVNVSSTSTLCDGTIRVVPGEPEQSCVVLFYRGRLGEQDLDWVDQAEIDLMWEWIAGGALP